MYKKIVQRAAIMIFGPLFLFSNFIALPAYAESRDCDGNALIYCGTMTRTELTNKLNNGTGKQYQSGAELRALFARYGFDMNDINSLRLGSVTKGNLVYVGNTVVARNVYTMGRHNIAGSTRVSGIDYPVYQRHPSVSFLSSSLPAYVYLNYDGSMAYAIIRSCGNIVVGVGKRERPAERINITVQKYEDVNGNGTRDNGEAGLSGWQFRVSGDAGTNILTTDANGLAVLTGMTQGVYVVTEVLASGWRSTTGLSQTRTVSTDQSTQTFVFGNVRDSGGTDDGGGDIIIPEVLPATGLAENIAIVIVGIFAVALLAYFGTRLYLKKALRGHRTPTNPKDIIKELKKSQKKNDR